MLNAPCLDCPERCFKCHSVCEKYIAFRAELNLLNEAKRLEYEAGFMEMEKSRLRSKYHAKRLQVIRYSGLGRK